MASPEAAAILRELQQQRDNGVRAVPTAPSDFPIDFGIHAHRYVTPMGNDQRAVAPALTPLTKSAGSPDRPGTACRPWGCAFGHFWRCAFLFSRASGTDDSNSNSIPHPSPDMRRLQHQEPAVGLGFVRHLHVLRVLGCSPRARGAHFFREVGGDGFVERDPAAENARRRERRS